MSKNMSYFCNQNMFIMKKKSYYDKKNANMKNILIILIDFTSIMKV